MEPTIEELQAQVLSSTSKIEELTNKLNAREEEYKTITSKNEELKTLNNKMFLKLTQQEYNEPEEATKKDQKDLDTMFKEFNTDREAKRYNIKGGH